MSLAADLARVQDEHIRLAVLRLLDDQSSYQANDSVLHSAVNAMGLTCTRDQMRSHLTWLAERGGEVAKGRSVIRGVQRPSPKGD